MENPSGSYDVSDDVVSDDVISSKFLISNMCQKIKRGTGMVLENFRFHTPITRSYLRWTTNFHSIICNFDEVTPY